MMDEELKMIVWLAALVFGFIIAIAAMDIFTSHQQSMACIEKGGSYIKGECRYFVVKEQEE